MNKTPVPQIMQRAEAIYLRRPTFYTGRPCKHGHFASRYTSNGGCLDCMHPKAIWPTDEGDPLQVLLRAPRGTTREFRDVLTQRVQSLLPAIIALLVVETGLPDPYEQEKKWKAERKQQIQGLRASLMPESTPPAGVPRNLTEPSD